MSIDIQLYSGNGMEPEIGTLGEFPCLYIGTEENEQERNSDV